MDNLDTTDERIQDLLCRWASARYGASGGPISRVSFEFHSGYGGGCDTCGYGADEDSLEVHVYRPIGRQILDEAYGTELINDILKFAVSP